MAGRVLKPRKTGADDRPALRSWQHIALVLALWGTAWTVPAFSLVLRAVGTPSLAFTDVGEGESESSGEEPVTDAEACGVVPSRSRLVRDLMPAGRGTGLVPEHSAPARSQFGRSANASTRCVGSAVQLSLRC